MRRRKLFKYGLAGSLAAFLPRIPQTFACDPTSGDIEGPFYTPNAPQRHVLYPEGAEGERLFLTGTVYYSDCQTPVANAGLDVWQADHEGDYDNVGFNYRGNFPTDALGNYAMETILPGKYLNGAQFRPRHIHFKVKHEDTLLTTQLYFEGDTDIPADPWASDPDAEGRIIPLSTDQQDNLHGVFDIFLNTQPLSTGPSNGEQDNNRIISVFPNPLRDTGQVAITVRRPGRIRLHIVDLTGKRINSSAHEIMTPIEVRLPLKVLHKYGLKVTPGVYILQLEVDKQIVDAKRVIVQ